MDTHGYSNGHFSEKYVKGVAWSTQEKSWATRATNIQKKVINHCHSWATRANKHIEKDNQPLPLLGNKSNRHTEKIILTTTTPVIKI